MKNFASFNLPETLLNALNSMSYKIPTPIQEKTIPLALQGEDILGTAQTGTGKTGAFIIPLIVHLLNDIKNKAIILTPTRELAKQVYDVATDMLKFSGNKSQENSMIRSALLIGGQSIFPQFRKLKKNPNLIIGTPGRVNDHLNRTTLSLSTANFFVLDEIDRMLDMGFGIEINQIIDFLPFQRQTLMFSATMPKQILKLSKQYLNKPHRISIGNPFAITTNVVQDIVFIKDIQKKYTLLTEELNNREGTVIIFVKSKIDAENIQNKLLRQDYDALVLHGGLKQRKRDFVLLSFRNKKSRIMVATDIAARGLDIPHIAHVINYDIPHSPEDYIHRIGRTARAEAKGNALSFVSQADKKKWITVKRFLKGKEDDHKPVFLNNKSKRKNIPNNYNRKKPLKSNYFKKTNKS